MRRSAVRSRSAPPTPTKVAGDMAKSATAQVLWRDVAHNAGTHELLDMRRPLGFCTINGIHYCRLRIPKDLIEAYGGRHEVKVSLRTGDYLEGRRRCIQQAAQFEQEFAERRADLLRFGSKVCVSMSEVRARTQNYVFQQNATDTLQFQDFDLGDTLARDEVWSDLHQQAMKLANANDGSTAEDVARATLWPS
jgi:hypothetical protein